MWNVSFTALLDIMDTTTDEPFELLRYTGTVDSDGIPSATEFTVSALPAPTSYQEADERDLERLPEGDRHREAIWFYTGADLRSIQAIGDRAKADRVRRVLDGGDGPGRSYVVYRVDGDRSIGDVAGALCLLLDS
jgi:hypothetical protein